MIYNFAQSEPIQIPKIDLKTYSGFPAISKDGDRIAVVSVDRGDYSEIVDASFLILNAKNQILKKIEFKISKLKKDNEISTNEKIKQIAQLLKQYEFSSLPSVNPTDTNKPESFDFGNFHLKAISTKNGKSITIEKLGHVFQTIQLPNVTIDGVCAGDLNNPQKKAQKEPNLHQIWHSDKFQFVVIEYGVWGTRDGCEGIENYMAIKMDVPYTRSLKN